MVRVAIVGDPGGQHGIGGGAEPPGQAQVHVVEHVEKLVRALIAHGLVIAQIGDVSGAILAAARRRTAAQAQPSPQAQRIVAAHIEPSPLQTPGDGGLAAHVQPQHGAPERLAVVVHADGAFALGRATHGHHAAAQRRIALHHGRGGGAERVPPRVRVLFGSDALHVQLHRFERPGEHLTVQRHQRAFAAGGSQIHRQHQRRIAAGVVCERLRAHQNV